MKKNKLPATKNKSGKREAGGNNKYGIILLLFIVFITAIIYASSCMNGFVNWDDDVSVYKNSSIQLLSLKALSTFFTSWYSGMYQPLTTLCYALIYNTSGLDPHAYHTVNLIFHLLNTVLVFFIFRLINTHIWVTALIAIFFAIHPMHVESVAWISELKDVLYTFFLFAALISYIQYAKNGFKFSRYLITLVLFLCSLLSKSAAVIFPVLLFAFDYYMNIKMNRSRLLEKIPFLAFSVLFGIINLVAQQQAGATEVTAAIGLGQRLLYACYSLLLYVFKFFVPANLSNIYPYSDVPLSLLWASSAAVLLSVILFYKYGRKNKDLVFGLAFFLINVILVINIIPIGQSFMAERYSYVSYVGLIFLSGQFVLNNMNKIYRFKTHLWILSAAAVVFFSYASFQRTKVWKDGEALWRDAINKHPDYFYGHYGLGNALREKNSLQEAIKSYTRSIQLNPGYASAYNDRGVAKDYSGNYSEALADYTAAIDRNPKLVNAYVNRAIVNVIIKNYDAALKDFNTALEKDKNNGLAYFNRGVYYLEMKKLDEACADWEKARQLGNSKSKEMIEKFCE